MPDKIVEITVKVRSSNGKETTIVLDSNIYDAVFVSMEALEKFAFPYYQRIEGESTVRKLRNLANQQLTKTGVIIGPHKKQCLLEV